MQIDAHTSCCTCCESGPFYTGFLTWQIDEQCAQNRFCHCYVNTKNLLWGQVIISQFISQVHSLPDVQHVLYILLFCKWAAAARCIPGIRNTEQSSSPCSYHMAYVYLLCLCCSFTCNRFLQGRKTLSCLFFWRPSGCIAASNTYLCVHIHLYRLLSISQPLSWDNILHLKKYFYFLFLDTYSYHPLGDHI